MQRCGEGPGLECGWREGVGMGLSAEGRGGMEGRW